jgi:predicted nucleic acid-binding protein
LTAGQIKEAVSDFLKWKVVVNTGESIFGALDLGSRYQISFWNALILQAATSAAVGTLYTEDLSHGQSYGPIRVINPFN